MICALILILSVPQGSPVKNWAGRTHDVTIRAQTAGEAPCISAGYVQAVYCAVPALPKLTTCVQVFSMFLEMLPDFIANYASELHEWLYVLLTQLLKKTGTDLLGSVQAKVNKALQIARLVKAAGCGFGKLYVYGSKKIHPTTGLNFVFTLSPPLLLQGVLSNPAAVQHSLPLHRRPNAEAQFKGGFMRRMGSCSGTGCCCHLPHTCDIMT